MSKVDMDDHLYLITKLRRCDKYSFLILRKLLKSDKFTNREIRWLIEDYAITLELKINSDKIDQSLHRRPDNMSLSDTYVDKVWLQLIDNRLRAELCVHQWLNEFIAYQLSSSLRKYGYSTREQIYILEETMEFGHGHIPDKIDEHYEPHLPEIFKIDWNFINEFYRYYHKYVIHIVREFLPKGELQEIN